jgi:hypothetical protein
MLRDDILGGAGDQFVAETVVVERLVADQAAEAQAFDQLVDADAVMPLAGQQLEADEIAERVGEGEDLGGPAAPGGADGLALSPPLAPWPCR